MVSASKQCRKHEKGTSMLAHPPSDVIKLLYAVYNRNTGHTYQYKYSARHAEAWQLTYSKQEVWLDIGFDGYPVYWW